MKFTRWRHWTAAWATGCFSVCVTVRRQCWQSVPVGWSREPCSWYSGQHNDWRRSCRQSSGAGDCSPQSSAL